MLQYLILCFFKFSLELQVLGILCYFTHLIWLYVAFSLQRYAVLV